MNTLAGILVTARLGSSRLPRKHLLPMGDRPALGWLLERMRRAFSRELLAGEAVLAIAATTAPEDAALEALATDGIAFFQGSTRNIPLRHHQAALALGLTHIVSVDGDDVLCAPEAARAVLEALLQGAPGARTEGLPLGMNAWGYATSTLRQALRDHEAETLETGWGRIFDMARFRTIPFAVPDEARWLRMTLDYPEDLAFFRAVLQDAGPDAASLDSHRLIDIALAGGSAAINQCRHLEYWNNFEQERAREQLDASRGDIAS